MSMSEEAAETLALKALAWLAADQELMGVFMGATGAAVEDLRNRAADRAFLGSVLDFLTMDDAWVMRFCDETGQDYALPMTARAVLAGEAQTHWT